MLVFAVVALPALYSLICDAFGLNGKTGRIELETALTRVVDKDRLVTVEFVTSVNSDLPWEFRSMVNKVQVHPGELAKVSFYAKNLSDRKIVGQAIPSLSPGQAAPYFSKTECFCFSQQTFEAKQGMEMPVRFVVDPRLPKRIKTVTLSYTFLNAGKYSREGQGVALNGARAKAKIN
jgi:cytochrome c oxidase assembly protein subunit 11